MIQNGSALLQFRTRITASKMGIASMTQGVGQLLESVIRITAERDKQSLEKVLLETLADFIDFDALILLRMSRCGEFLEEAAAIPGNARQDRLELVTRVPGERRIKHDDGLDRCIDRREIVSEARNGTSRILFPVVVGENVAGILAVYAHAITNHALILIRGFLRIHGNFLAVLDDNEHDTLTGLLNRRTFDTRIAELLSLSRTQSDTAPDVGAERREPNNAQGHWLGVLDIDHFKRINDTHGHIYGDEVLLLFSGLMKKTFRSMDLLFRYGGEEFVAVLAPLAESDAFAVFERFRRQVEQFDFPQIGRVTVSIGMAKLYAQDHSTAVVEHADKALYYAKANGRNQTRNYHQLIQAGILNEQRHDGGVELF